MTELRTCFCSHLMLLLIIGVTATSFGADDSESPVNPSGIQVAVPWPPLRTERLNARPMAVPYLQNRPEVIPIDQGRQLLVDDFLIERTTLERTFHQPVYHPQSPVVRPDQKWEQGKTTHSAMVYSDGVWYDPTDQLFKMWYLASAKFATCLATSCDGIHWSKPAFDVVEGTNIVCQFGRDASTVWLDHDAADPSARFKMFRANWKGTYAISTHHSPDGIHWSDELYRSGPSWDRTSVYYNPFRKAWVYSVRGHDKTHDEVFRVRCHHEGSTAREAADWELSSDDVATGRGTAADLVLWVGADHLDPHHPDPRFQDIPPQLYNLDVTPYENLLVGLFTIWQGPDNETCKELGIQKRNEVLVGFSRDGFHWDRTNRQRFLEVGEHATDWNGGNVQSAGGGFLIVDDELYFYCSGRAMRDGMQINSTGLATLRRDGFASLDANGGPGELMTRPVRFEGKHLFVNVAPQQGALRAEIVNQHGDAIPGYRVSDCLPVQADSTRAEVRWQGKKDLSALAGQPIRFRFLLTQGSLYAFWVSQDQGGASNGATAAGGPGIPGPRDTGTKSIPAAKSSSNPIP